jgi:hypothetical protein
MSLTTKTKYEGSKQEDAFKEGFKDRGYTLVQKIGNSLYVMDSKSKKQLKYNKQDFAPTREEGYKGKYIIDFTKFDNKPDDMDVSETPAPKYKPNLTLKEEFKKKTSSSSSSSPPPQPQPQPQPPPQPSPKIVPVDPTAPPVVADKLSDPKDDEIKKKIEAQNEIIKKLLAQQVTAADLEELSKLSLVDLGDIIAEQSEADLEQIALINEQQGDQTRQVLSDQGDLIRDQIEDFKNIFVLSNDEAARKGRFKEGKSWLVDRLAQGDPVIENRLLGVNQSGDLEMEMIIKKLDAQNQISDGTRAIVTIAGEEYNNAATQAEKNQILKDVMEELVKEDARKNFKDKLLGKKQGKKLKEEPLSKMAQFNYTNQLQREIARRRPLYSY